jgi:hypothetical protein
MTKAKRPQAHAISKTKLKATASSRGTQVDGPKRRKYSKNYETKHAAHNAGSLGAGNRALQEGICDDDRRREDGDDGPQCAADAYLAWLGQKSPAEARNLKDPERTFIQFAEETGRVLAKVAANEIFRGKEFGGEEHWVYLHGGRVWKVLRPGRGYPIGGDPLEYVQRLGRLHATAPQLEIRLLGILPVKGKSPRIVTCMEQVCGRAPTTDYLRMWLGKHGWIEIGKHEYRHAASGVEMADAAPDNFVQVGEDLVPIDVWFSGEVNRPMPLPNKEASLRRRKDCGKSVVPKGEPQTTHRSMSARAAIRAAVIAAREATESLRRQSPGTLEEAKAQGRLTSRSPDDLDG